MTRERGVYNKQPSSGTERAREYEPILEKDWLLHSSAEATYLHNMYTPYRTTQYGATALASLTRTPHLTRSVWALSSFAACMAPGISWPAWHPSQPSHPEIAHQVHSSLAGWHPIRPSLAGWTILHQTPSRRCRLSEHGLNWNVLKPRRTAMRQRVIALNWSRVC